MFVSKSECKRVFISNLLAIWALTTASINKITPESSIIPYHSSSMPLSFLCISNSFPPPLSVILFRRIFYQHGPDECMEWKLCLPYGLTGSLLCRSIIIEWNVMKIHVSFWRICHIWQFIFLLNWQQTECEQLQLSCYSQGPKLTQICCFLMLHWFEA